MRSGFVFTPYRHSPGLCVVDSVQHTRPTNFVAPSSICRSQYRLFFAQKFFTGQFKTFILVASITKWYTAMIKRDKTTYTAFDWEFIELWAPESSQDYLENVYKYRSEIGYKMVKNHMKQLAFFDFLTEPKNIEE